MQAAVSLHSFNHLSTTIYGAAPLQSTVQNGDLRAWVCWGSGLRVRQDSHADRLVNSLLDQPPCLTHPEGS